MSIVSFMKCLTAMDLSLVMKDVKSISRLYKQWETDSTDVARQYGIYRDFVRISGQFQKTWEFTEAHGTQLGAALKTALPKFVADTSITHEQIALLKDLSLFMRKDSGPAWTRISKNVSLLGDNQLAALFLDDDSNEVADLSTQQTLEKIVFQLTGRKNDPLLSYNEVSEGKKTHPKLLDKYIALRKDFKARFTQALLKFVRISGKPIVDIKSAKNYLKAMGCDYLPIGFVGKVDEKGKLYTTQGKALKGTMVGRFEMNVNYDPKTDDTYYARLLGDMRGELRTAEFLKHSKTVRMSKVGDFSDNLERHRTQWLKGLDSLDAEIRIAATIIEAIHLTHARIGGVNNQNDGKPTYGMSTLLVKQIRQTTQGLEFKYPGKKGTIQHHTIHPNAQSNRKVIANIKECLKNKNSNDVVFTINGRPIKPREVNGYLRSLGVSVTVHKFRHAIATSAAKKMLEKSPFNKRNVPTQAQAERWIKEEALKIGTLLHHRSGSGDKQKVTSATAFAAYIDPAIVKDWFMDLGLRVPKWLPEFEDDE